MAGTFVGRRRVRGILAGVLAFTLEMARCSHHGVIHIVEFVHRCGTADTNGSHN